MLSSRALRAARDAAKSAAPAPIISPVVVRSLYRRLFREVSKLDADPMAKTLFPLTTDLQAATGTQRPLYVPGSKKYVDVLRKVFRDGGKTPNIKLAFDTLNRLRAHDENVKAQLPALHQEREAVVRSLASEAPKHAQLFRAEAVPSQRESGPRYVPSTPSVPSKLVLRDRALVELEPGTVLLAHPLSSTHVDRRVMIITERTSVMTSGVVLDLQFIFPISRGNPMFPEVFWGHDVYDGGFNQINLTMPPTAQVVILHTLEPPTRQEEREMERASGGGAPAAAHEYVSSWLKWGSSTAGATAAAEATAGSEAGKKSRQNKRRAASLRRQHELLCQPIIKGATLPNGEREPTLYVSKVEALPYLAKLAAGQPRSSLRVYWGSMRWMTQHIEAEVGNGHWFPVKVSPAFFRSYDLTPDQSLKDKLRKRSGRVGAAPDDSDTAAEARFPTEEDLAAAKRLREKRFGVDVSIPQVFPAEGAIRRRECLWDEILYALGGEFTSLVGGVNPFMLSGANRNAPQILAPLLPSAAPFSAAAVTPTPAGDADDDQIDDVFSRVAAEMEAAHEDANGPATPEPAEPTAPEPAAQSPDEPSDDSKRKP